MDGFIEAFEVLAIADGAFLFAVVIWLLWKTENRILDKVETMINAAIKPQNNTQSFFQKITDELNETKTLVKNSDRNIHEMKALLTEISDRDPPTN